MYFCKHSQCGGHDSFAVTCFDKKKPLQSDATTDAFKASIMQERRQRARWRVAYRSTNHDVDRFNR